LEHKGRYRTDDGKNERGVKWRKSVLLLNEIANMPRYALARIMELAINQK
jgi:hypothetical protein